MTLRVSLIALASLLLVTAMASLSSQASVSDAAVSLPIEPVGGAAIPAASQEPSL